jgi:predicted nucleic acid-binding protein
MKATIDFDEALYRRLKVEAARRGRTVRELPVVTVGLDTSVTVRLLLGEPADQAEAARRLLAGPPAESALLSDLVVGETYFVLRHHYRVPHRAAVGSLRALLDDPRIQATGVARSVLAAEPESDLAPGLMDRLIHQDYRGHGAEMVTFDRDAARLEGARLLG